jgi:hypothetical protein
VCLCGIARRGGMRVAVIAGCGERAGGCVRARSELRARVAGRAGRPHRAAFGCAVWQRTAAAGAAGGEAGGAVQRRKAAGGAGVQKAAAACEEGVAAAASTTGEGGPRGRRGQASAAALFGVRAQGCAQGGRRRRWRRLRAPHAEAARGRGAHRRGGSRGRRTGGGGAVTFAQRAAVPPLLARVGRAAPRQQRAQHAHARRRALRGRHVLRAAASDTRF